MERLFQQDTDNRKVSNPVVNKDKFTRYTRANDILVTLADRLGTTAEYDGEMLNYSYHTAQIAIPDEPMYHENTALFSELCTLYDSMYFVGDSSGNITIMFMMNDIYMEGSK